MEQFKINITDWLMQYDKNSEIYYEMFKKAEYYQYEINNSEIDNDKIIFYDKDVKKIFMADFEYLGVHFPAQKIWIWAWAVAQLKKKYIAKSKKILQYGFSLDEQNYLKLELVNSRFIIDDQIQIDIHLSVASELAKIPCIFKMITFNDYNKEITIDSKSTNDKLATERDIFKIQNEYDPNNVRLSYLFLYNIVHV